MTKKADQAEHEETEKTQPEHGQQDAPTQHGQASKAPDAAALKQMTVLTDKAKLEYHEKAAKTLCDAGLTPEKAQDFAARGLNLSSILALVQKYGGSFGGIGGQLIDLIQDILGSMGTPAAQAKR